MHTTCHTVYFLHTHVRTYIKCICMHNANRSFYVYRAYDSNIPYKILYIPYVHIYCTYILYIPIVTWCTFWMLMYVLHVCYSAYDFIVTCIYKRYVHHS